MNLTLTLTSTPVLTLTLAPILTLTLTRTLTTIPTLPPSLAQADLWVH